MAAWILLTIGLWGDVSPEPGGPAGLHLRIDQGGGLSSQQLKIVVEQIQSIWRAANVRVTTGGYGDAAPSDGAIVSLRVVWAPARQDGSVVLGWVTPDVYEQLTPAIFVSLDSVRELLAATPIKGRPFNNLPRVAQDRFIAQAVGRVAAHELGHYFLRSSQHDEHGLMRRTYQTSDLTSPTVDRFQIEPAERSRVRLEVAALSASQFARTSVHH